VDGPCSRVFRGSLRPLHGLFGGHRGLVAQLDALVPDHGPGLCTGLRSHEQRGHATGNGPHEEAYQESTKIITVSHFVSPFEVYDGGSLFSFQAY
jgi:hypothetical protein